MSVFFVIFCLPLCSPFRVSSDPLNVRNSWKRMESYLVKPKNYFGELDGNFVSSFSNSPTRIFVQHRFRHSPPDINRKLEPEHREGLERAKRMNRPTGKELKKHRERDPKKYKLQNPYKYIRVPIRPFKFSEQTINETVFSLNQIKVGKISSSTTVAMRVGCVDWAKFNETAHAHVAGFAESARMRRRLIEWAKYHVRKGDISLTSSGWAWDIARLRKNRFMKKKLVLGVSTFKPAAKKASKYSKYSKQISTTKEFDDENT